jgi:hypothetical protein
MIINKIKSIIFYILPNKNVLFKIVYLYIYVFKKKYFGN